MSDDKPKIRLTPPAVPAKVRLKADPPAKINADELTLRALDRLLGITKRELELERLDQAIMAIDREGYSKTRLNELNKTARAYAKSSSEITAKELLDFYAKGIIQPYFGGQVTSSNRTEQDERNVKLLRDMIYGLTKAIATYEGILERERKQGRL